MARSKGNRPGRPGRRRAGNKIGILIWLIVILGAGAVLIAGSVVAHGDAARTSYTQAHGVRRAAHVLSEDTSTGRDPTSTLAVQLSGPVNGHGMTTVHIQGTPTYSPGALVTVVVDPQDPGYAELPGAPYTSSGQWKVLLGLGLGLPLMIPTIMVISVLLQSRSQRRLRQSLLR